MATSYTVHFNGGPCNGTERTISADQLAVGAINCQGTTYVLSPPTLHSGFIVFFPAQTAAQESARTRALHPHAVAAAWHRLMHTLAVRAPHQIRRQHAANARLHRLSRTGRM